MFQIVKSVFFFSVLCVGVSCTQLPEFESVPKIELLSVSKYAVKEGQDSVYIKIRFEDGDGDIGAKAEESIVNAYFTDSRTGLALLNYKIPYIEPNGRIKALSGEIEFQLFQGFTCLPSATAKDTFKYQIYIVDRAGNKSNSISTQTFTIDCQ